ncbi:hypothetical protein MKW92_004845 [Papaver armeniacum]|nr:hypothetical protein MKW92_004845 [Papaver armeniacum]
MEDGSPSDGNVSFSNLDHTNFAECPTAPDDEIPDYDMINVLHTETGELDYERFMQYFTNISRVYMFSRRIFEDISFFKCTPKMKLDICICFVESIRPAAKDKKWMRELKQLSFALTGRLVISSILCV